MFQLLYLAVGPVHWIENNPSQQCQYHCQSNHFYLCQDYRGSNPTLLCQEILSIVVNHVCRAMRIFSLVCVSGCLLTAAVLFILVYFCQLAGLLLQQT